MYETQRAVEAWSASSEGEGYKTDNAEINENDADRARNVGDRKKVQGELSKVREEAAKEIVAQMKAWKWKWEQMQQVKETEERLRQTVSERENDFGHKEIEILC